MAPKDGDTKVERGFDMIYRDPPGAWQVKKPVGPMKVTFDPRLADSDDGDSTPEAGQ